MKASERPNKEDLECWMFDESVLFSIDLNTLCKNMPAYAPCSLQVDWGVSLHYPDHRPQADAPLFCCVDNGHDRRETREYNELYEGVYSFSLKVSLFTFTHISLAKVSHSVYLTLRIGGTNQNHLVNLIIHCAIFILDSKTRK